MRLKNLNETLNFKALTYYLDEIKYKDYQYDNYRGLPQKPKM